MSHQNILKIRVRTSQNSRVEFVCNYQNAEVLAWFTVNIAVITGSVHMTQKLA